MTQIGRGEVRTWRAGLLLTAALLSVSACPAAAQERAGTAIPQADPPGIDRTTKRAIREGLRYLVSVQNRDGSWRTAGATGSYPTAMTSLSGLALLASGSTPTQGPYARHVSAALSYVLKCAQPDGLIAQPEEENHCMHGHGFAMLFLAQCYGMEEDPRRQARIRTVLQNAVELTARAQSYRGGWLYTPDARADEGSVTVTQVQGLRAARNAGIGVPKETIDKAMQYLRDSANPDGGIRYQVSDSGPSRPAITAAAVACYFNAGLYKDEDALKALEFCEERLHPSRSQAIRYFGHYYYAHLYMAQVMYIAGEDHWGEYFPDIKRVLLEQQRDDGSWIGDHVGATYGTAVALLILQLPYKNLPIMQR